MFSYHQPHPHPKAATAASAVTASNDSSGAAAHGSSSTSPPPSVVSSSGASSLAAETANTTTTTTTTTTNNAFPARLHYVLSELEKDGTGHGIISWLPDGTSFQILNKEKLQNEILCK